MRHGDEPPVLYAITAHNRSKVVHPMNLSDLDPQTFQHLVNSIAIGVLGAGTASFAPGADGGRDGYFEGSAPYPSEVDRWSGRWFLQAKHHRPKLSGNEQTWLLQQVQRELKEFSKSGSKRRWPDVWIIATNIDPSATPDVGSFDKAKAAVAAARPELADRFDIWGGSRILSFLERFPEIARRYGHFLTPGHVLSALYEGMTDARASIREIIKILVQHGLDNQRHTKLDQAGSQADHRPGVHKLFIDLPIASRACNEELHALSALANTSAEVHRIDGNCLRTEDWKRWRCHPDRASIWVVKGGPGQGKSTIGQFFCQIQRAALLLGDRETPAHPRLVELAQEIEKSALAHDVWPGAPRVPVSIDLKEYAYWSNRLPDGAANGIISYVRATLEKEIQQTVEGGTLKRALQQGRWIFVFDGLDEVPSESKDEVARQIQLFLQDHSPVCDLLTVCTSRPQGYSGEFDNLYGACWVELLPLPPSVALQCAELVLRTDRTTAEAEDACLILQASLKSPAVRELMTTPLQAHIMAVIVRGGQRPPERRWELFRRFYDVIRSREVTKTLEPAFTHVFLREDALIKQIHNRLGFLLQARAENASGAQASLPMQEFERLVRAAAHESKDGDVGELVRVLMKAATERLVLISTPETGAEVRFDIRQLQEFFAGEFIYDGDAPETIRARLKAIGGDSHWREVTHFVLSALVEANRRTALSVAVDTLRWIDAGGEEDQDARALCRRLAAGALSAAKLLEDGVLESHKGNRNLFRDCITPIASATSPTLLGPLERTRGPASSSWLIDLMLELLEERDASETLGASVILCAQIKDGDPRIGRVRSAWKAKPIGYIGRLLSLLSSRRRRRTAQRWLAEVIIASLASETRADWNGASEFLSTYTRMSEDAQEWISTLQSVCQSLLGSDLEPILSLYRAPFRSDGDKVVGVYGPVSIVDRSKLSDEEKSHLQPLVSIPGLTGQFALLQHVARFALEPERLLLLRIYDLLGSWAQISSLPFAVATLIPQLERQPSLVDVLAAMKNQGDAEFLDALSGGWVVGFKIARHASEQFLFNGDPREKDLGGLWSAASDRPLTIARLWLSGPRELCFGNHVDVAQMFLIRESLRQHEELFAMLSPADWPSVVGDDEGLRQMLLRTFTADDLEFWHRGQPSSTSFALRLPSEENLLVAVAGFVLCPAAMFDELDSFERRQARVRSRDDLTKYCATAALAFVPDIDALLDIARSERSRVPVRCSALLLAAVHPHGGIDPLIESVGLVCQLAADHLSFAFGVLSVIEILQLEGTAIGRALASSVLQTVRPAVDDAWPWDDLLDRWRERSRAPMSKRSSDWEAPILPAEQ